ncbi:MAG: response regulator [Candidatus Dormibacteraeota bacterium]|nr:response regulator [Candidatus Dormibacteraeota bacterium]
MGGRLFRASLSVSSHPNLRLEEDESDNHMLTTLTPLPAAPEHARGAKVLIVDDEPVWRMILATDLTHLGYQALVAGDAADALRQVAVSPPAAAIIDLMLPGSIDGRELAARLQVLPRAVPVLFYSAAYDASLPREYLADAFAFVSKAAERADLYSLLARAIA